MRILQINTVYPYGSTGKIAKGIHDLCINEGIECITAFRYTEKGKAIEHGHSVSSWLDCHIHNRLSSLTMLQGVFSYFRTRSFLRWVSRYAPDIIHLHNIHGSFINHSLLFAYIKKKKIPVVWTLHDCWAFTGHCPHFDMIGCNQWKTVCQNCPQKQNAWLDLSRFMHRQKKKWFSGVEHLHLAANSNWTAAQARQSYLGNYPIRTIYNGIDLSVFKPVESDFAKQYGCEGKHIVLAVAFGWGEQKGLDVIIALANTLDSSYQMVLVGTNDSIDKMLPESVISIHRTDNQAELARIYSAADVFINPTREETFGLVNIEALACGTPVVTFKTGGSPECIDVTCGTVVEKNDTDSMRKEIIRICTEKPYSSEMCVKRAEKFNMYDKFHEYIELYKVILGFHS